MPPFRKRPILVDPRFDGDALKELRDIGHGHRVNVVDASYDIPRGAKIVKFPGSSADALKGIVRLIPVEDDRVDVMLRDPELRDVPNDSVYIQADHEFDEAMAQLIDTDRIELEIYHRFRQTEQEEIEPEGFYAMANEHGDNTLYVLTIDELPFACASIVAGHSQRAE